jgi:hypothetical protein
VRNKCVFPSERDGNSARRHRPGAARSVLGLDDLIPVGRALHEIAKNPCSQLISVSARAIPTHVAFPCFSRHCSDGDVVVGVDLRRLVQVEQLVVVVPLAAGDGPAHVVQGDLRAFFSPAYSFARQESWSCNCRQRMCVYVLYSTYLNVVGMGTKLLGVLRKTLRWSSTDQMFKKSGFLNGKRKENGKTDGNGNNNRNGGGNGKRV